MSVRFVALTVRIAVPNPTPVIETRLLDGCVCPAGIITKGSVTVTLLGSLLVTSRNTFVDSGRERLIESPEESPGERFNVAGTMISSGVVTVMLAVASAKFGAWARTTAVPGATPVTGTVTLVCPAAMVAVDGTVATPVALEEMLNAIPPAGAGPDNVSVRLRVSVPGIVRLDGEKVIVAVTCTGWDAEV